LHEQSLYVEFDELFSLRERLRSVADQVRSQLLNAGLRERLDAEVFDEELELRSAEGSGLLVRLDSFRLEIQGARPEIAIHSMAALILMEAEVFRLNSVELGLTAWYEVLDRPLGLVALAFSPGWAEGEEMALHRRFAMSWEWASPTGSYSFTVSDLEDQELMLSLKARESYMTVPELRAGHWVAAQKAYFQRLCEQCLRRLGW